MMPAPTFSHAYIQERGNGRLLHESMLLRDEIGRRGIPCSLYTQKRILRRDLSLNAETFIAGDMDAMHGAMKQLGIEIPPPDDYPDCLAAYFHRRVWRSTLAEVERCIYEGDTQPFFAKPADRRKSFTGRVFSSSSDFYHLGGVSRRQAVWCSEPVRWLSEYRVYVLDHRILSIDHYDGDSALTLHEETINAALSQYRSSGTAPIAYGIDFGVLANGSTALVEANDGYALGAYQIGAAAYTDLLLARWDELLRGSPAAREAGAAALSPD